MNDTQQSIADFLRIYRVYQDYILRYHEATEVDPNANGAIEEWLEADASALRTLRELKASAAASSVLQKINDDVMASNNHGLDCFLPRRPV